jgi:hypothetical protein
MAREPIVSGQFYPEHSSDLKSLIEEFTPKSSLKISAKGIILPHAGYVYSGRVAVTTVNMVLPKKRLLILGPNHTGNGSTFSLGKGEGWKIPGKEIETDQELAAAILSRGGPVCEDDSAHLLEHSIEVELPILDYFFGSFKFVPLACRNATLKDYREAAGQLSQAIKSFKQEVLLIASTDLTHYEPDSVARKKDRRAIEAIINLDEEELIKRIRRENITLCGEAPLAIFIAALKNLGAKKSRVSLYQTSGDASGEWDAVVGYVGIIVN